MYDVVCRCTGGFLFLDDKFNLTIFQPIILNPKLSHQLTSFVVTSFSRCSESSNLNTQHKVFILQRPAMVTMVSTGTNPTDSDESSSDGSSQFLPIDLEKIQRDLAQKEKEEESMEEQNYEIESTLNNGDVVDDNVDPTKGK